MLNDDSDEARPRGRALGGIDAVLHVDLIHSWPVLSLLSLLRSASGKIGIVSERAEDVCPWHAAPEQDDVDPMQPGAGYS